jgi:hypothetical protein
MDGCGSTPWRPPHPGATAVVVREGACHRSQWLGRPAAHTSSSEKLICAELPNVARVLHVVDVVERHVEAPHLERELPPRPLRVAVEAADALEALQPPVRVAR